MRLCSFFTPIIAPSPHFLTLTRTDKIPYSINLSWLFYSALNYYLRAQIHRPWKKRLQMSSLTPFTRSLKTRSLGLIAVEKDIAQRAAIAESLINHLNYPPIITPKP